MDGNEVHVCLEPKKNYTVTAFSMQKIARMHGKSHIFKFSFNELSE